MNSTELQQLKEDCFTGVKTVKELKCDMSSVPARKGVYIVLRENDGEPKFVETGTGGFFKKKNPNVSIVELNKNWLEDSSIMYMGKAGGQNNATLSQGIAGVVGIVKRRRKTGSHRLCQRVEEQSR